MVKQVAAGTYGMHNTPQTLRQAREAIANGDYKPVVDADIEADPGGRGVPTDKIHRKFLEMFTPPGTIKIDCSLYLPRDAIVPQPESQEVFWAIARDFVFALTGCLWDTKTNAYLAAWKRWRLTQGEGRLPTREFSPRGGK